MCQRSPLPPGQNRFARWQLAKCVDCLAQLPKRQTLLHAHELISKPGEDEIAQRTRQETQQHHGRDVLDPPGADQCDGKYRRSGICKDDDNQFAVSVVHVVSSFSEASSIRDWIAAEKFAYLSRNAEALTMANP